MLVHNVEVVDGSEGHIAFGEGLKARDNVEDFRRCPTHLAVKLTFKPFSAVSEGEVYLFGVGAGEGDEVICENIECRSEIVDSITEDQREIVGKRIAPGELNPILAGVSVTTFEGRIRVVAKVRGNFRLQLRYVSMAAIELQTGALE